MTSTKVGTTLTDGGNGMFHVDPGQRPPSEPQGHPRLGSDKTEESSNDGPTRQLDPRTTEELWAAEGKTYHPPRDAYEALGRLEFKIDGDPSSLKNAIRMDPIIKEPNDEPITRWDNGAPLAKGIENGHFVGAGMQQVDLRYGLVEKRILADAPIDIGNADHARFEHNDMRKAVVRVDSSDGMTVAGSVIAGSTWVGNVAGLDISKAKDATFADFRQAEGVDEMKVTREQMRWILLPPGAHPQEVGK